MKKRHGRPPKTATTKTTLTLKIDADNLCWIVLTAILAVFA
jgi:hypothetical protein